MNDDLREILIILQEECAEVIVDISKCFRFGPDQMMNEFDLTNLQRVGKELGDVLAMVELLVEANVGVTDESLENAKRAKFMKLKEWSNLNINK